ncbi:MAG: phosphatidylglycerophosphatase A [candidate division WOR-3 bacterium]
MGSEVSQQDPALAGWRLRLAALVASGLYTGYFPIAPATVTSFFTLLPAYYLARCWWGNLAAVVVLFSAGVPLATTLERVWGRDPKRVTIDEIVGTLITFFLNPVTVWGLLAGFFIWRFFDVVKLPFVHRSQNLPGGWGVMADDVLAGICANVVLRALIYLQPVAGLPRILG